MIKKVSVAINRWLKRGGFMLGQELCMMQLPLKNILLTQNLSIL